VIPRRAKHKQVSSVTEYGRRMDGLLVQARCEPAVMIWRRTLINFANNVKAKQVANDSMAQIDRWFPYGGRAPENRQ